MSVTVIPVLGILRRLTYYIHVQCTMQGKSRARAGGCFTALRVLLLQYSTIRTHNFGGTAIEAEATSVTPLCSRRFIMSAKSFMEACS